LVTNQLLTFHSKGKWEWEYAEPTAVDTSGETQYSQTVTDTKYTPRVKSVPEKLPPVDEDALAVEPVDRNYRHDEGVSDINRRMAKTSIESQSEVHQYATGQQYPADQLYAAGQQYPAGHQYPAGQQYPAEQQYPEGYQNAEGKEYEDYYEDHGDTWREKGSSEPQEHRRRDKRKGSSSKARDKNSGMKNFAHSFELN
jgi:hypothetical protein